MIEIPDYADVMSYEDFKEAKDNGWFIPCDGDGYYATESQMERNASVWSPVPKPEWATHVAWFNR